MIVIYWSFERLFAIIEIQNAAITKQPPIFHVGEVIEVEYTILRRRTCHAEIIRYLERKSDRREFIVQNVNMILEETRDVQASGFRIWVPPELSSGPYVLFSRARYYCNGLDWLWPRVHRLFNFEVEIVDGS